MTILTGPHDVDSAVAETVASVARRELADSYARGDNPRAGMSRWLPEDLIRQLAQHDDECVRAEMAMRPGCPADLLAVLAGDDHELVSQIAVVNESCPYDVSVAAGNWPLKHPDCPAELYDNALVDDPCALFQFQETFLPAPNLPRRWLDRAISEAGGSNGALLLDNPQLTHAEAVTVLERLTGSSRDNGVWRWSQNPNADPAWLAMTAACADSGPDQPLRVAVARNPATPADVLVRLADHAAGAVVDNPSCPAEALRQVYRRLAGSRATFGSAESQLLQARMAAHPACPDNVAAVLKIRGRAGNPDDVWYDIAVRHGRSPEHARAVLALSDGWTGTLGDLLEAAADVAAAAAA